MISRNHELFFSAEGSRLTDAVQTDGFLVSFGFYWTRSADKSLSFRADDRRRRAWTCATRNFAITSMSAASTLGNYTAHPVDGFRHVMVAADALGHFPPGHNILVRIRDWHGDTLQHKKNAQLKLTRWHIRRL